MRNLFKCWHERLFHVSHNKVTPYKSDLLLELRPINFENASLVNSLRGAVFEKQFLHQLSLEDVGYFAFYKGNAIGYGWIKHPGSDDYFFKISEGCCYLCRFFVHESVRGHGVYAELISSLIAHENGNNSFYIAVERGNVASEKGLKKVGFSFVKEYSFIRGLKYTMNKRELKKYPY